jgi:hypothetical protein
MDVTLVVSRDATIHGESCWRDPLEGFCYLIDFTIDSHYRTYELQHDPREGSTMSKILDDSPDERDD